MMKGIYNYVVLSVLALAATGCINEELNNDRTSANSGDEVQFGLSLEDLKTKTVYGDEVNNAFPIYWVDGDKVQVFSPQCLDGRRNAEYKVILPSEDKAYYADDLTPTGEYGVQWGESATADFYSLYPSGSYTLSSDGTKAENITISNAQTINVTGEVIKSDMEDCLLYAKTENVSRGSVVNLRYNPISTVVMLTVKVAASTDAKADEFTIQSISLTAPEGNDLAGTFSLNIEDGTFGEFSEEASETVSAEIVNTTTGGYHVLKNQESLTIPLFLAPKEYGSVKEWKVQVVANNYVYTKTLNIVQPLKAGMIHKITLPELKPETTDWDVSSWMKNIPRNVYLSEISIPGSWNSLNGDFQTELDVTKQYEKGVRAFHIDTRWKRTGNFIFGYEYALGTADGGSTSGGSTDKYMSDSSNPTFEETLTSVVEKVASDEYMVIICSFAQNSAEYNGSNGWIKEISTICDKFNQVYDAKKLSPDTVVGDVLGSVIVIVNVPEEISSSTVPSSSLAENSKCFFTYLPSELTANHFNGTDDNKDELWTSTTTVSDSKITMYNNQAQITSSTGSGISTSARGYAPSVNERTAILENIVNWSKGNYGTDNYEHDQWIYLGLGGYQVSSTSASAVSGSYSTIASKYNTWIDSKVEEMGTTPSGQTTVVPYYPVGIVLMNYVSDYSDVVKNILLLNNKYRLQYDPTKPVDYTPGTSEVQSVSANYSAAVVDTGADAISWE